MVNRFALVSLSLIFLWVAIQASALGNKDGGSKPQKVEVSGIVRLVGNVPFSSLLISGDREWYIVPEEQKKLMDMQHQKVTVRGQEYYYDRTFANGTSAGRQYYLKKIVIVKPK